MTTFASDEGAPAGFADRLRAAGVVPVAEVEDAGRAVALAQALEAGEVEAAISRGPRDPSGEPDCHHCPGVANVSRWPGNRTGSRERWTEPQALPAVTATTPDWDCQQPSCS
jgi:hypothetical protein